MYGLDDPGRGARQGAGGKPRVTPQTRPSPMRPATTYSPPPPVISNTSGQYAGGGGRPVAAPVASQGPVNNVGAPVPNSSARQAAVAKKQNAQSAEKKAAKEQAAKYRAYLGNDTVYQSSINDLKKQLEDYILSNNDKQSRVKSDFELAASRMGDERTKALDSMKNDFGARGLLNSSEFLKANGDYNTQYDQQLSDLTTSRDQNIADLLESLGLFKQSNATQQQNAKQEAIRRRTEAFGGWAPGK